MAPPLPACAKIERGSDDRLESPRLLTQFLRQKWYVYASGILFIAAANIVQVYYPKLIGQFTDELDRQGLTSEAVVHYGMLLLAVGVGYVVLGGIGQLHIMYAGRLFEFHTRKRLFDHFTSLTESFYAKQGVGKLLSYMMNDIKGVRESISSGVNQTTNAVMLIAAAVGTMLLSQIPLYLIAVCVAPLLVLPWLVVHFGPVIRARSKQVQDDLGRMTETAEEQLGGIRVTKKFAVESVMNARFGETVDRIRDDQIRLVRVSSLFQALIPFMGALSLIVTIAYGGYLALSGTITIGNFVALTLYVRMMVNPLQQIGNVINTMQRSRASLERLNELFAVRPEVAESPDAIEADFARARIEVRRLTFAYPDSQEKALRGIDLAIEPGRTLGIVGRTGSGKTTLMKLLLRLYDPPAGAIRIGQTDIRDLTLESLRSGIAYVPQDGFLFSTTIQDNIAFYKRDAAAEAVTQAAKQAQIYHNIKSFPEQFDTKLGERGVTLSGGQRQRTSLARGLIKNAPILILDDSVSAVDAVTERRILETVRAERRNRTTIVIAHRISAVMHADEIIVLDEGKIVQRGKHEELIAKPGIYADLYAIQEEGSRYA